jgi:UDP-N-acetylglucosamine 4-epimerase
MQLALLWRFSGIAKGRGCDRNHSPYAITKYVNELYADIFSKTYGLETIGLRYLFWSKQDPNGAYAAVIPKFVMQLMNHHTINGDGNYSRDFTYIENVIQMNELAMTTENSAALNTVYNTAFGDRNTLNDLVNYLKEYLAYDPAIANAEVAYGPNRVGDIPHSLASIAKSKELLEYNPQFSLQQGLKEAIDWYWNNLK